MAVKEIVDWSRTVPCCSGVAVYAGDLALYSEAIDREYVSVLLDLLRVSPCVRKASAAAGGFTFVAFYSGDHIVLLRLAGRFPALPDMDIEEPKFIDPSCVPALPSQEAARLEAEAALLEFGLLR